jgi:hypothetical protein
MNERFVGAWQPVGLRGSISDLLSALPKGMTVLSATGHLTSVLFATDGTTTAYVGTWSADAGDSGIFTFEPWSATPPDHPLLSGTQRREFVFETPDRLLLTLPGTEVGLDLQRL